jgi:hypothetical protein
VSARDEVDTVAEAALAAGGTAAELLGEQLVQPGAAEPYQLGQLGAREDARVSHEAQQLGEIRVCVIGRAQFLREDVAGCDAAT